MNTNAEKTNGRKPLGLNGLLSRNPVLVGGLLVFPAVMLSPTLVTALTVCVVTALMCIPTIAAGWLLSKWVRPEFRIGLYPLIASLIYVPIILWMSRFMPQQVEALGFYLPLLVVNSFLMAKSQRVGRQQPLIRVVLDATVALLGFSWVVCLMAIVREYLGNGTFFGVKLDFASTTSSAIFMPFAGFIMLGILAAGLQLVVKHRRLRAARRGQGQGREA